MTSVNLSGGNLSANASNGANMQLRSGNVTVALQEGTAINANIGSGSASPLSLQVTAGSATISGANGTHSVSQGEGLSLDAEGVVTSHPITIIEPPPLSTIAIIMNWRQFPCNNSSARKKYGTKKGHPETRMPLFPFNLNPIGWKAATAPHWNGTQDSFPVHRQGTSPHWHHHSRTCRP